MRLVRDHAPAPAREVLFVLEQLQHVREGLEGAGDDVVALFDRLAQLRGLRPSVLANGNHQTQGCFHHLHVLAHVGVQRGAVGDDDDRIEGLLPILRHMPDQTVGQPRDGFGFPGTRGVLDQVTATGPAPGDIPRDPLHRAELVVAGEDQFSSRGAALRCGVWFPDCEVAQDAEEHVTLQHVLPQVGGLGLAGDRRVASPAVETSVEGQEEGIRAFQRSGHVNLGVGDGKVDQSPAWLQEAPAGAGHAVFAVLLAGVRHRLGVVGLQLHRHDGDAIDGEHEVDGLVGFGIEVDLADDAQDVFLCAFSHLFQQRVRGREGDHRAESGGAATDLGVFEAFPQGAEQPAEGAPGLWVLPRFGFQPVGDIFKQFALRDLAGGFRRVRGDGLGVLLRVLGGQPLQDVLWVEREAPIPALVVLAFLVGPAALSEGFADSGLVRVFAGDV